MSNDSYVALNYIHQQIKENLDKVLVQLTEERVSVELINNLKDVLLRLSTPLIESKSISINQPQGRQRSVTRKATTMEKPLLAIRQFVFR